MTIGWLIAILVLLLAIIFAIIGLPDPRVVLLLIAGLAVARLALGVYAARTGRAWSVGGLSASAGAGHARDCRRDTNGDRASSRYWCHRTDDRGSNAFSSR